MGHSRMGCSGTRSSRLECRGMGSVRWDAVGWEQQDGISAMECRGMGAAGCDAVGHNTAQQEAVDGTQGTGCRGEAEHPWVPPQPCRELLQEQGPAPTAALALTLSKQVYSPVTNSCSLKKNIPDE